MSLPVEQGGWSMPSGGDQSNSTGTIMTDTNPASTYSFISAIEKVMRRNAKGHKVSLLITSAFSLAAAMIVILVVLFDARAVQQRSFSVKKRARPSLWSCIHTAEIMPLATAIASVIQSCIFLGVQSQSLGSLWVSGCTRTAQLIWPAIWIVAFTVTAFSLESTFRSLQSIRFEPRGKMHLLVSVLLIKLLLFATFITARVLPSKDICWGSLTWWAIHFVQPSIALSGGIILVNLVTGVVLVIQLLKTIEMCRDERIAASRVIYSLCINIVILTLTLPWFVTYALGRLDKETSLMADSVVTLNGLLHGVILLFLRTNSEPLAIRPKETPWTRGRPLRLFGPNDLNIHDFISTPIVSNRDVERTMLYTGKEKMASIGCEDSILPRQQFISIHPDVPPPPFSASEPKKSMSSATSYTLFPSSKVKAERMVPNKTRQQSKLLLKPDLQSTSPPLTDSVLKAMTERYEGSVGDLKPPRPLFLGHKRNESETTSAIVEIALRLSSAPSDADSVYVHEPFQQSVEPIKLTRGPSLLSPDRYVHSAMLAEAAKSRPTISKEQHHNVDLVEIHKPLDAPRLIGLFKNSDTDKKTLQQNIRDSIAARIASQHPTSEVAVNKKLPPVPSREKPQEAAALEALIKSSHPLALAPVKPVQLPIPDWRQSAFKSKATDVKAIPRRPQKSCIEETIPEWWL